MHADAVEQYLPLAIGEGDYGDAGALVVAGHASDEKKHGLAARQALRQSKAVLTRLWIDGSDFGCLSSFRRKTPETATGVQCRDDRVVLVPGAPRPDGASHRTIGSPPSSRVFFN